MVVAHFFESASDALVGASESAPLLAGAVALASTGYIAAIDEKAGGATSLGPGVQGSHSVSRHCPRNSSRAEYARRKVESPFGAGAGSQPNCGRRDSCSLGERTLRSLVPTGSSCVLAIAYRPFYYDSGNVRQKSWGATHRT